MVEIARRQHDHAHKGHSQQPGVDASRTAPVQQEGCGQIWPDDDLGVFPQAFIDRGKQSGDGTGQPRIEKVEGRAGQHGGDAGENQGPFSIIHNTHHLAL